jgi:HAD superfamily hydrolase (TIGR01490 family)
MNKPGGVSGKRPFAVFDIDGTIVRWQLYHAIGDQLARRGQIDARAFQRVRDTRLDWKRRTGQASFQHYETELIGVFDQALTNLSVDDFSAAAEAAFNEYKDQVYAYTRDLIQQLKAEHYWLFAISASPNIVVEKLANYYGFDDFAGSVYEIKAGRFTGDKDVLIAQRKPVYLKRLLKKYSATLTGSLAVGDSESDIELLSCAETPIAFNPTKALFEHAQSHGWKVVVERKNMVYQLEPNDGAYRLVK